MGMVSWPYMILFEYVAPIVEAFGYLVVPLAIIFGNVSGVNALGLFLVAVFVGAINSLMSLLLDERFGYFNDPAETMKLVTLAFIENLGVRQVTVWWRIRAMFGANQKPAWGDMERRGVGQLTRAG